MAKSKITIKTILIFLVLIIIYIGSIIYRVRLSKNPEYYDPNNPTAFYWTENALQYHYAELIAHGKSIPSFDPTLQAPEGVKIFENLTIFMEYPCGWLYKFLRLKEKNILFHTWTILFIAGWASLGIFAAYFLSRALGINQLYSIIAALLSSFSLVAIGRSTFGFLNEDFAIPFIFCGLASYLYALRSSKNNLVFALIAGGCFLISLASWHFSRFIFLAIVIITVFNLWLFSTPQKSRIFIAKIFLYLLLIPFLGSFIFPVLRNRLYFLSPVFGLGFGSIIGILCIKPDNSKPLWISTKGVLAIFIGVTFLLLTIILTSILNTETEYTHVWHLFWYKLKYLGIKPSTPDKLDYPARSLWIEAFNSPHLISLFKNLFPIIIPALLGIIHLIKKRKNEFSTRLFIFLCLIFFLSYLAIERMGVLNNYLLVVLCASIGLIKLSNKFYRYISVSGLLFLFLFNFYEGYHLHQPTGYIKTLRKLFGDETTNIIQNWRLNDLELVRYIKFSTAPDAIFLSSFGVGPLILTYANRAIVLQPKFEVKNCQKKVKEFFYTIYDSEENFYNLCKKWQVQYFVYDIRIILDNSQDGSRWIANKLKLSKNSVAFLMHFAPEELKHFELVYQNNFYRLFRIIKANQEPKITVFPYQPVYDLKVYGNQLKGAGVFDDSYTKAILDKIRQAKVLMQRATQILINNPMQSVQLMERSVALYPSLIGAATTLGIAKVLTGEIDDGLILCQKEVNDNPLYPLAHYNLAYAFIQNKNIAQAKKELKEALKLEPGFLPAIEMLKQIE